MLSISDVLRAQVAAIVTFIFFSNPVNAAVDARVGTSMRSYPLSGVVEADVGYGILLWGTRGPGSPWYGYVRPTLELATAGTYNAGLAAVEVFPLSILGFRLGGESIQNDKNYSPYDCVQYHCRGRYYRSFVEGHLTLGAGPYFMRAGVRRERWSAGDSGVSQFIEPTAGVALYGTGDYQTIYRGFVGMKLSSEWSALGAIVYSESSEARGVSRFPLAVMRYQEGPLSVSVGGGLFSSTLKAEEMALVFSLAWAVRPGLELE